MIRRIFFGLIILFFVELAGLIVVGQAIGVVSVLLLLVAGAVLGVRFLRASGLALSTLGQVGSADVAMLGNLMTKGLFRAVAGLLLVFPGFLTDILAGLMLLPPVSQWFARRFMPPEVVLRPQTRPGPTIEGEGYEIAVHDDQRLNDRP